MPSSVVFYAVLKLLKMFKDGMNFDLLYAFWIIKRPLICLCSYALVQRVMTLSKTSLDRSL
uniref:Uncharacterized protein n=1 Tax=Parascaris univalens TaxID=6257 RepID=A0A915A3G9_PARUN